MVDKADEQIRKAMADGQFENLAGKGKPLRLDDNPFEDPTWSAAYHMLRESGYSLPWIEKGREIDETLDAARKTLRRAWEWKQNAIQSGWAHRAIEAEWKRAIHTFTESILDVNKQIFSYNLEVPTIQLQRMLLNVDKEIEKITRDL